VLDQDIDSARTQQQNIQSDADDKVMSLTTATASAMLEITQQKTMQAHCMA
jgi:hypothetical protein